LAEVTDSKQKIGIFGGAFDPPHLAHLALAQHAVTQFGLSQLLIIPTGDAWHKSRPLTEANHRIAMARLAFAGVPQASVDLREINRQGPTYSFDTLQALAHEHPHAKLFLFIGADQANAFKTWHRWQDVLSLATVVVAERPVEVNSNSAASAQWHNAVSPDVQLLDMPSFNVSATQIRAHFAEGPHLTPDALSACLPSSVQHYIEQHSLYR
jgi:nicotinate-nucleotide adenylyltransferase